MRAHDMGAASELCILRAHPPTTYIYMHMLSGLYNVAV